MGLGVEDADPAGLLVPYTSAFCTPFGTGTYGPLPDRLPARCPEKTGRLRRKLNFGTSTIDRAPGRSDRFQAINPERQPALLVCWVARLSIRQQASGAAPCEVVAQAHECIGPDENELSGNVCICLAGHLDKYH